MDFGCIGSGGVENNKDRPSECLQLINVNECEQERTCWYEVLNIQLINVNECEQERTCWYEFLLIYYQSII